MSTTTIERPRQAGPGSGLGGDWRVIVRNDNHNTFDHVARTLASVLPNVTLERGHAIAEQIHNSGQAIVWSGPRETGRALLAAARLRRADDGPAGAVVRPAALRRGLLCLLAALVLLPLFPSLAGADPALPQGFQDTEVFKGLEQPTAVRFAPNGMVFVAEKAGKILVYENLEDETPELFKDLRTEVYNHADRGLLGLAVDPAIPDQALRLRALHLRPRPRFKRTCARMGRTEPDRGRCPAPD